jgi:hypothetical protein
MKPMPGVVPRRAEDAQWVDPTDDSLMDEEPVFLLKPHAWAPIVLSGGQSREFPPSWQYWLLRQQMQAASRTPQ